jgi:hypothetical protein
MTERLYRQGKTAASKTDVLREDIRNHGFPWGVMARWDNEPLYPLRFDEGVDWEFSVAEYHMADLERHEEAIQSWAMYYPGPRCPKCGAIWPSMLYKLCPRCAWNRLSISDEEVPA